MERAKRLKGLNGEEGSMGVEVGKARMNWGKGRWMQGGGG